MTPALPCLAALLVSAAGAVATVDGVEIDLLEVRERMTELGSPGAPSNPEQALESLVLDVVLGAEARRAGLAADPLVRERLQRERRRAAAALMSERDLAALPPPTEEELRRAYHLTADSVRLRMLVFPSEDAARVNLALVQKTGSFDDAARSAVPGFAPPAPSAPQIRGELPSRVAELAFRAPLGAPAGPVELDDGWAIVQVQERTVGSEQGFAARRAALEKFTREQRAEAMRGHVKERLRAKAKVTVDGAFLDSLGKRLDPTPAELEHVVATVDGRPIRYREIEPTIRQLSSATGHAAGPELRRRLLENEIGERILESAAAQRGLLDDPRAIEQARRFERRVLATELVERIGRSVPPPTEAEIGAFYRANVAPTGRDLPSTRGAIARQLHDAKAAEAMKARMGELRSRAKVVVDQAALGAAKGG